MLRIGPRCTLLHAGQEGFILIFVGVIPGACFPRVLALDLHGVPAGVDEHAVGAQDLFRAIVNRRELPRHKSQMNSFLILKSHIKVIVNVANVFPPLASSIANAT